MSGCHISKSDIEDVDFDITHSRASVERYKEESSFK